MNNLFYSPILKWKKGERYALRELNHDLKKKTIPLIELVKKEKSVKDEGGNIRYIPIADPDTLEVNLNLIKKDFTDSGVFVDTIMLTGVNREKAIAKICQKNLLFDDNILPVIHFFELQGDIGKKILTILNEKSCCLRINGDELHRLGLLKLTPEFKQRAHLMIDFGVTDRAVEGAVGFLTKPEIVNHWISTTIASGAFPKDLMEFSSDKVGRQKRADWLTWKQIKSKLNGLSSINYGDYTIRYPIYENLHTPNTSYSFRYTGDDEWFVFRGLSKKAKGFQGGVQYRAHALTIVNNAEYQFSGENFSKGDMYIKSKAKLVDDITGERLTEKCGNSTTWIQAGVNHHICKVIGQLGI